MKHTFLDLGKQPIANNFVSSPHEKQYFFDLQVQFDDETNLVSLANLVEPEKMFNESYVYHSSNSRTMVNHFERFATAIRKKTITKNVLEIGSNDGVFIKHFHQHRTVAVEPCKNFADITNDMGYKTYPEFWSNELALEILENHGKQDVIYSANCMCHIHDLDEAFKAVHTLLSDSGLFVFEDPSLQEMINRNSYDQLYDEHAHIFSLVALQKLLNKHNLAIVNVENLSVHGGSNRIYATKSDVKKVYIPGPVRKKISTEKLIGLDELETFNNFRKRVEESKKNLVNILTEYKEAGKKIVGYGATSKSTTVYNYCGIGTDLIDYIVDTTPAKQGKFSPGVLIPVVTPDNFDNSVDIAFLAAWNYRREIMMKEREFLDRGGIFVTHVPDVHIIKREEHEHSLK